jgi:hypothetical protein
MIIPTKAGSVYFEAEMTDDMLGLLMEVLLKNLTDILALSGAGNGKPALVLIILIDVEEFPFPGVEAKINKEAGWCIDELAFRWIYWNVLLRQLLHLFLQRCQKQVNIN